MEAKQGIEVDTTSRILSIDRLDKQSKYLIKSAFRGGIDYESLSASVVFVMRLKSMLRLKGLLMLETHEGKAISSAELADILERMDARYFLYRCYCMRIAQIIEPLLAEINTKKVQDALKKGQTGLYDTLVYNALSDIVEFFQDLIAGVETYGASLNVVHYAIEKVIHDFMFIFSVSHSYDFLKSRADEVFPSPLSDSQSVQDFFENRDQMLCSPYISLLCDVLSGYDSVGEVSKYKDFFAYDERLELEFLVNKVTKKRDAKEILGNAMTAAVSEEFLEEKQLEEDAVAKGNKVIKEKKYWKKSREIYWEFFGSYTAINLVSDLPLECYVSSFRLRFNLIADFHEKTPSYYVELINLFYDLHNMGLNVFSHSSGSAIKLPYDLTRRSYSDYLSSVMSGKEFWDFRKDMLDYCTKYFSGINLKSLDFPSLDEKLFILGCDMKCDSNIYTKCRNIHDKISRSHFYSFFNDSFDVNEYMLAISALFDAISLRISEESSDTGANCQIMLHSLFVSLKVYFNTWIHNIMNLMKCSEISGTEFFSKWEQHYEEFSANIDFLQCTYINAEVYGLLGVSTIFEFLLETVLPDMASIDKISLKRFFQSYRHFQNPASSQYVQHWLHLIKNGQLHFDDQDEFSQILTDDHQSYHSSSDECYVRINDEGLSSVWSQLIGADELMTLSEQQRLQWIVNLLHEQDAIITSHRHILPLSEAV